MPTYYLNPLGQGIPISPSPGSNIESQTPDLSTANISIRQTTLEESPELSIVKKPGFSGQPMKVLVAFKLYIVSKNKKKEKTWIPVGSSSEFPVSITLGVTGFDEFRELVAVACNEHFKSTGGIIRESIEDAGMPLFWLVSIPRIEGWKKGDKVRMSDASDYDEWLQTAFDSRRKAINLDLKMNDPAEAKRRAKKEDLLAKREARVAAVKESVSKKRKAKEGRVAAGDNGGDGGDGGGGGSEDSNDSGDSGSEIDADDFDDINFHMRSIYRAHPTNTIYDRLLPVYIDPTNPRKYIVLSAGKVQLWAKDLMERTTGVSLQAPPSSLKFITMSSSKRAKFEQSVGPNTIGLLAQQLLQAIQGNSASPIEQDVIPTSSPPNETNMEAYLDFISVRNKDEVLEVLTSNDLTSHKIFKGGLPRKDVMDLGLTLGTVTKLFESASKFDRHLAA